MFGPPPRWTIASLAELSEIIQSRAEQRASHLALSYAHTFLSNGFSDEFISRDLIRTRLRAFMKADRALPLQGLVFALLHLPTSLHDEPTKLGVLANVVALNVPFGVGVVILALRTHNFAVPAVLHAALDTTMNVLS